MGKKYKYNEIKPQERMVSEPMVEYGNIAIDENPVLYDIPKDLLIRRVEQAEEDFKQGKGIPLEDAIKKILG
ncbi:MAG: hypothetical protein LIP06_10680 [Tannerellaceae bacterium]|nr:hypothetical protein [Tannerellaceae bacterium]